MVKLFLSLDGNPVKEFRLVRNRTTIGRRPSNDIQIDNLAVSGVHAAIELTGAKYFIEDLGSTNGTMVNGQPIQRLELSNGDDIKIAKYCFKFWRELNANSKETDFEETMLMMSNEPENSPAGILIAENKEPTSNQLAVVRVLTGVNVGRELVLNKNVTSLGKTGVQVALISRRLPQYYLSHVEGRQRPLVNGREIGATPYPLAEEDLIEILGVQMAFFFR